MPITIPGEIRKVGPDQVMTHYGPKPKTLSETERYVLETFVDLESVKLTAVACGLSDKTIEFHLSNIRCKLKVRTLIGLVKCVLCGGHYAVNPENRI